CVVIGEPVPFRDEAADHHDLPSDIELAVVVDAELFGDDPVTRQHEVALRLAAGRIAGGDHRIRAADDLALELERRIAPHLDARRDGEGLPKIAAIAGGSEPELAVAPLEVLTCLCETR